MHLDEVHDQCEVVLRVCHCGRHPGRLPAVPSPVHAGRRVGLCPAGVPAFELLRHPGRGEGGQHHHLGQLLAGALEVEARSFSKSIATFFPPLPQVSVEVPRVGDVHLQRGRDADALSAGALAVLRHAPRTKKY